MPERKKKAAYFLFSYWSWKQGVNCICWIRLLITKSSIIELIWHAECLARSQTLWQASENSFVPYINPRSPLELKRMSQVSRILEKHYELYVCDGLFELKHTQSAAMNQLADSDRKDLCLLIIQRKYCFMYQL